MVEFYYFYSFIFLALLMAITTGIIIIIDIIASGIPFINAILSIALNTTLGFVPLACAKRSAYNKYIIESTPKVLVKEPTAALSPILIIGFFLKVNL